MIIFEETIQITSSTDYSEKEVGMKSGSHGDSISREEQ